MPLILFLIIFWSAFGLIAYTYVLFPLLLAGMARVFSGRQAAAPEDTPEEDLPRVAMIVAAYNEAAVIADKLINTWKLDYPRAHFEILIGSDGSDDGTDEILKSCDDVRLRTFVFPQRRGKISVLNDLLKETDADIVVMSDANTSYSPDAVRHLVRHFQDPRVGCVSGELSLEKAGGVSGEGLYWRYEGWIKRNEHRLGFLIGCNGGIFALRRTLYEALPASTIVEDFVLTMRVLEKGYTVRFEPLARATEPPCATAGAEMTRKIRIGAGGWQALGLTRALLHPRFGACAFAFWGHKVLRWLVPHLYLVGLAANIALLGNPFYRAAFVLQALGALTALFAYHVAPGRTLPRWTRPISYFYLMNYALARGFLRFVFGTQRVTWDRAAGMPAAVPSEYPHASTISAISAESSDTSFAAVQETTWL